MSKLYHTSDIHLSFKADGTVQRPMDQRSWSKGSPNYVGYLEKLADFGKNKINSSDFCVVTGDLTHDQKGNKSIHSFRWMRANFNGTIIACRGNHDQGINFAQLRLDNIGSNFYLLDEGEIITVGPYTFGCYSDHENKTNSTDYSKYVEMAKRIVAQAQEKNTIPVMISHYPLPLDVAQKIKGLTAYLSGHVHCTKGGYPDGNNWEWYDAAAKPTDNKTVNDCFYSTGTTDVLLNLEGQIFKEIQALEIDPNNKNKSIKNAVARAFNCAPKFVDKFEVEDTFNPGNTLAGFMCRAETVMGGSLYITHVNGVEIDPQLIYGTPKLAYPYKEGTTELIDFPSAAAFYMATKWNGTNVLFYKYYDSNNNMFITAKTKGTAVLRDGTFGNFFSLTREALGWDSSVSLLSDLPGALMPLLKDSTQSMSFELCGRKEPHLVQYNFDIALVPLFTTREDGRIEPAVLEPSRFTHNPDNKLIQDTCREEQSWCFGVNEQYRTENNLPLKYEYEHFAVEGKVLYLLDYHGICISRTLYKVKPKDIEEVHWQSFNNDIKGRVLEAINKIKRDEQVVTPQAIQMQLDMGPKEWDKFGKDVLKFANLAYLNDTRKVIVLVGLPGSGKSTLAAKFEQHGYVRVNQDELGSRKKCKTLMSNALAEKSNVVVDRCNFDVNQRKAWIDLAKEHGVKNVYAIYLDTPINTCKNRVITRQNHPTIAPVEGSKAIVDKFAAIAVPIGQGEGFVDVLNVTSDEEAEAAVRKIIDA